MGPASRDRVPCDLHQGRAQVGRLLLPKLVSKRAWAVFHSGRAASNADRPFGVRVMRLRRPSAGRVPGKSGRLAPAASDSGRAWTDPTPEPPRDRVSSSVRRLLAVDLAEDCVLGGFESRRRKNRIVKLRHAARRLTQRGCNCKSSVGKGRARVHRRSIYRDIPISKIQGYPDISGEVNREADAPSKRRNARSRPIDATSAGAALPRPTFPRAGRG